MSTLLAFLADMFVFTLSCLKLAPIFPVETMADIGFGSRFSALSLGSFALTTCAVDSNSIRCDDGLIVLCELFSVGKQHILPLSDLVPDCSIIAEQLWVYGDRLCREKFFDVISVLPEFVIPMGEEERGRFDDKIVGGGPLAARFNSRRGFWSSKLDFSSSNTSDTFVSAVDVMERTEDGVDVDRFSFDECVPFRVRESSWCACGTSDPSFDSCWISLQGLNDFSSLVAALVCD